MKRIIRTLLPAIFSVCVILCINSNSFAGVEADGSFSYSYPIEVPPGTAGMAPQLAIVYNSNTKSGIPGINSPLGAGFDIAGLGCITRDTTHPIVYNDLNANHYMLQTNRFFQGERLIRISGNNINGDFHFENESFSLIEAVGPQQGDGPSYWKETKPDGTMYYYGYTDGDYSDTNSKVWALKSDGKILYCTNDYCVAPPNGYCVRAWALSRIEDPYGNCIKIIYRQDNGEYYPSEIIYTENTGFPINRYRSIKFGYDETSRQDYYYNDSYGLKIITRYLLNKITIKVDGDEVYTIEFNYDFGDILIKSRLTKIINSGDENTTVSMKWNNGSDETSEWSATAGGAYKPPIGIYPGIQSDLVDIDGDGLLDCVRAYKDIFGTTYKKTFLNRVLINGSWEEKTETKYLMPGLFKDAELDKVYSVQLVDINGDSLTDCIIDQKVYLNTGDGWSTTANGAYKLPIAVHPGIQGDLVDIDGDGLLDCVLAYKDIFGTTYKKTFLNRVPINGSWEEKTKAKYLLPGLFRDAELDKVYWIQLVDINGDSLTDCIIDQNVYLNTADGWSTTANSAYKLPIAIYPGVQSNLIDVNGDGYFDCVRAYKDIFDTTYKKTFLYLNDSWMETTNSSYIFPGLFKDAKENILYTVKLVDFNGDGLTDYSINNSVNTNIDTRLRTGTTKNHLLTNITDSFGTTTTVKYTPAAQFIDNVDDGATDKPVDPTGTNYPYNSNSSARYLVEKIITTGSGASYTKNYSYNKGRFYIGKPYQRKDMYFECVTKQNEAGMYTKTYYKQGNHYYAGKIDYVEHYASNRKLMKKVQYAYYDVEHPNATGINLVKLKSIAETTYECGISNPVSTNIKTFNSYDIYGNPTQITEHSSDTSLPDIVTTISYLLDTDAINAWILTRPTDIKQYQTSTSGILLKRQVFEYYTATAPAAFGYELKYKLKTKSDYLNTTGGWVSTTFTYDPYGNIASITTPKAATTGTNTQTITYDDTYHTFPKDKISYNGIAEFKTTTTYDPATGNILTVKDFNNNITTYAYDSYRRLQKITEPGDYDGVGWTKFFYYGNWTNPATRYVEIRSRDNFGHTGTGYSYFERVYFDSLKRKYRTESKGYESNNMTVDYTYDSLGRLSTQTNPYLASCDTSPYPYIKFEYDASSRLKKKTYPDGSWETTTYSREADRLVVTFKDKNGIDHVSRYDSRGRLRNKIDDPATVNASVSYVYDALGRLASTMDAGGSMTTINYDSLGRKTSMTDPNAGTTLYEYWNSGHIKMQTDARGKSIDYTYDDLYRLKSEISSDDTVNAQYSYDGSTSQNLMGRLNSVVDDSGETIFSYDMKGNLVQYKKIIDTYPFQVDMEYDQQRRLTTIKYPDGYPNVTRTVIKRQYADAGYLKAVTDANDRAFVQYTRESCSVNAVKRITGNGVTTTINQTV